MKKKLFLVFLGFMLVTPLCRAAFLAFSGPSVILNAPKNLTRPNREAYKPYPAPRGEVPMSQYIIDNQRQLAATGKAFEDANKQFEQAIKTADTVIRDFNELVMAGVPQGKNRRR